MADQVVEVELPNGTVALVRVNEAEVEGAAATKVAWPDRFHFKDVAGTVEGVAQALRDALEKVAPDQVTIEFSLQLSVQSGKLTGMLVEGSGTGSLTVTLEWQRGKSEG